ncbi:hypothetical protein ACXWTF_01380 [Thiomicrolovo sp. ZZH C-3]
MKTKMISVAAALIMAAGTVAAADFVTLPYTFDANTTARAAEVNANFSAIAAGANANNGLFVELNASKQNRVTGACGAGMVMESINADGSVVCKADIDTDSDTTYTAGTGLTLAGTTFSINTAQTQARVYGYCSTGYSIRVINSNGSVTCEKDDVGTGDITSVTAGSGLSGGGISGDVTLKRADGYVSVHNSQLVVDNKYSLLNYGITYAFLETGSASTAIAYANVNLPDGATVTSLECTLYNDDPAVTSDPHVTLYRVVGAGAYTMADVTATGDSPSLQTVTDTTIAYPVVINSSSSYVITYVPNSGDTSGSLKRFYACRVGYGF